MILPDSTILADYMLAKMTAIVADMRVFPERMKTNLELTHGLVFSGQLLQDLVEEGVPRDEAYKMGAGKCDGGVGDGNEFSGTRW